MNIKKHGIYYDYIYDTIYLCTGFFKLNSHCILNFETELIDGSYHIIITNFSPKLYDFIYIGDL